MKDGKIIVTTPEELEGLIEGTVRKILSENKKEGDSSATGGSPLLLSLKEAAQFLKLAPQTIYGFTSKRLIPFLKRGKKLYFKRSELEQWLDAGKKKSVAQMKQEIQDKGTLTF